MALTVTQPFADHQIGDVITDPATIAEISGTEAERFVVRTADPEPSEAAVDDGQTDKA